MLSVSDLTVTYDDFTAVDAIDLEVADGEIVCILGPSGSGKSSLLRAISGLEPPAAAGHAGLRALAAAALGIAAVSLAIGVVSLWGP